MWRPRFLHMSALTVELWSEVFDIEHASLVYFSEVLIQAPKLCLTSYMRLRQELKLDTSSQVLNAECGTACSPSCFLSALLAESQQRQLWTFWHLFGIKPLHRRRHASGSTLEAFEVTAKTFRCKNLARGSDSMLLCACCIDLHIKTRPVLVLGRDHWKSTSTYSILRSVFTPVSVSFFLWQARWKRVQAQTSILWTDNRVVVVRVVTTSRGGGQMITGHNTTAKLQAVITSYQVTVAIMGWGLPKAFWLWSPPFLANGYSAVISSDHHLWNSQQ